MNKIKIKPILIIGEELTIITLTYHFGKKKLEVSK